MVFPRIGIAKAVTERRDARPAIVSQARVTPFPEDDVEESEEEEDTTYPR